MPDQVPKPVVQERYERLAALQDRISADENGLQIGREVTVLISDHDGKKDAANDRISGRAEDHRLVHLAVPVGSEQPRPGDLVTTTITSAAAFHLIADHDEPLVIRRTRAGDAWDRAQAESCAAPVGASSAAGSDGRPARVGLGLPTLRVQGGARG